MEFWQMHEGCLGRQGNPPLIERQAASGKGLSAECPAKVTISLTSPIGVLGWSQRRGIYLPLLPEEYIFSPQTTMGRIPT